MEEEAAVSFLRGCPAGTDAVFPHEHSSIRRNRLYLDPNLKGIIYHTIKFCDYYGFEYASIKRDIKVPLLKIETDFTSQSAGQLLTRIQAFAGDDRGIRGYGSGKRNQ